MESFFGRSARAAAGIVLLLAALLASPLAGGQAAALGALGPLQIDVLSNRADLVSGGDALVEVELPSRVQPGTVRVELNGADVTSAFAVRADGRFLGLVTGLQAGDNSLTARATSSPGGRITITNHPTGGPVFAGAQVQPWVCKNEANGLPAPLDAQCDVPAQFRFVYRSAATGQFTPYDPASPPAAGLVATTTTDQGMTMPYIVRIERGVMDRGIYDVAVLSDPAQPWVPWAPQPGWNHKVLWPFGGGSAPHHSNGTPVSVLDDLSLSRGFMVATNSLNVRGMDANDVTSAEAVMMLKEHIDETYGSIRYTIGAGCSGGSIQQHAIAANYPGLLDGIQPNCSYQDSWTTTNEVGDCHLLVHYFNATAPGTFTPGQQAAVEGTRDTTACALWDVTFAQGGNPRVAANCDLPAGLVYDPVNNPTGVRCTPQDYQVAIWGTRAQDGFARSPVDSVGIQYGLGALNAGQITAEQFVALNAGIGSTDIDLNFQAGRREADAGAEAIAYRTGQVVSARELADVPIIDLRGSHNVNDIHTDYHSYVMRARLDQANGTHANQIIWSFPAGPGVFQGIVPTRDIALRSLLLIDRWLSSIEADHSLLPKRLKVLRDRPPDAVDACFIDGQQVTDAATCAAAFPFYGDARLVAGSPMVDNVMKCQLRPLDPGDYGVTFTADQWARLVQAFPSGVCDYSEPPVDFRPSVPWLTYAGGPGGQPLGPEPRSGPSV